MPGIPKQSLAMLLQPPHALPVSAIAGASFVVPNMGILLRHGLCGVEAILEPSPPPQLGSPHTHP